MEVDSKQISKGIIRAVLTIALGALSLYILYLIKPLIGYILVAMVLSLIGTPIVRFLRKRFKLPSTVAVGIFILLLIGLSIGVVSLFIPLLISQGKNLSLLNISSLKENINNIFSRAFDFFHIQGEHTNVLNISHYLNLIDIPEFINSIFSFLGGFGIGFFSVLFITFFLLKDGNKIVKVMFEVLPKKEIKPTRDSLISIRNLLSRYFVGLIIQISILFILYTTLLLVVGVKNAFIIAVLCALLNLIPYLGPTIGLFVITLLTMTDDISADFATVLLPRMMYVAIGFLAAQLLDNFVNQPLIFSNSVKSHPLEIFFVVLSGGFIYGIVGMVIAIPTYTVIKVVLKKFASNNKFVNLLTRRMT